MFGRKNKNFLTDRQYVALVKNHDDLAIRLVHGNKLVKCEIEYHEKLKMLVRGYHWDQNSNVRGNTQPFVGFSAYANPTEDELSTVCNFISAWVDSHHFKMSKRYMHVSRPGASVYWLTPDWQYFAKLDMQGN